MTHQERLAELASKLSDQVAADVVDFAEYLDARQRARTLDAQADSFAKANEWLDAQPEEELTPEEAVELDMRQADDRAGAPRVSAAEANRRWG